VLHACTSRHYRGILGHPCFASYIIIFTACTIHTVGTVPYIKLVLYHTYCWYCTIHTVGTVPYIKLVLYHILLVLYHT